MNLFSLYTTQSRVLCYSNRKYNSFPPSTPSPGLAGLSSPHTHTLHRREHQSRGLGDLPPRGPTPQQASSHALAQRQVWADVHPWAPAHLARTQTLRPLPSRAQAVRFSHQHLAPTAEPPRAGQEGRQAGSPPTGEVLGRAAPLVARPWSRTPRFMAGLAAHTGSGASCRSHLRGRGQGRVLQASPRDTDGSPSAPVCGLRSAPRARPQTWVQLLPTPGCVRPGSCFPSLDPREVLDRHRQGPALLPQSRGRGAWPWCRG